MKNEGNVHYFYYLRMAQTIETVDKTNGAKF